MSSNDPQGTAVRQARLRLVETLAAKERSRKRYEDLVQQAEQWRRRVELAKQLGKTDLAAEAVEQARQVNEKIASERATLNELESLEVTLRSQANAAAVDATQSKSTAKATAMLADQLVDSAANRDADVEKKFDALHQSTLDDEIAAMRSRLRGDQSPPQESGSPAGDEHDAR